MTEQWLSIVEYARTLSVSDLTVRRRIKTGRLSAVLREGKYYIPVQVDGQGNVVTRNGRSVPVQQEVATPTPPAPQAAWAGMRATAPMPVTAVPAAPIAPVAPVKSHGASGHVVPHAIRRPAEVAVDAGVAHVDGNALIEFYESVANRFTAFEQRVESETAARVQSLEARLSAAQIENKTLRQQVEDLQVLVKLLEKRGK